MIKLSDILYESNHPDFKKVVKDYLRLTTPSDFGSTDMSSSNRERLKQIEKDAAEGGYLADLQTASYKHHFGRIGNYEDDELEDRMEWFKSVKNRITKDGKLNKNSATWLKNVLKQKLK